MRPKITDPAMSLWRKARSTKRQFRGYLPDIRQAVRVFTWEGGATQRHSNPPLDPFTRTFLIGKRRFAAQ